MFKKIAVLTPVLALSTAVHAALPAGVEDAVEAAATDGGVVVGALAVAGAAVFIIHKLLKRFGISL